MTTKRRTLLVASLFLGLCGPTAQFTYAQSVANWNEPCKRLLREYRQRPGPKAFALTATLGNDMSQYCGAAWQAASKAEAEAQAKSSCMSKTIGRAGNSAVPQPAVCSVVRSEQ